MRLRLPDGIMFSIVKGDHLIKCGHSKKGLKILKSVRYLVSLNIKKKKLEILRRANKGEKC